MKSAVFVAGVVVGVAVGVAIARHYQQKQAGELDELRQFKLEHDMCLAEKQSWFKEQIESRPTHNPLGKWIEKMEVDAWLVDKPEYMQRRKSNSKFAKGGE